MVSEAPTASTSFRLVILGDGSVRTMPLHGDRWVIGRSPDCEIPLRDPTVSRRHLLLERQDEAFAVKDLGGRNPLLVDGKPRSEAVVSPGQPISIGMTRLLIESRSSPGKVESTSDTAVITGREVIDSELDDGEADAGAAHAQRILERIEWTFADLGSLSDAAEPLLVMALNLTARQRGLIARIQPNGKLEPLATLDTAEPGRRFRLPEAVVREACRLGQVSVLTSGDEDRSVSRLMVPLGDGPDALLVLEEPGESAPEGQALLLLARSIGKVVWHRILEVRERLQLRDEIERLRFQGSATHNALLTSTRLREARQQLRTLANETGPVLLIGEEGTEREDLARYLHAEGNRRSHPFIALHLGLLPEHQVEKNLFGERQGAGGAIDRARGGTLFLDDLGALPVALQERLCAELCPSQQHDPKLPRLVVSVEQPTAPEQSAWHRPLLEEVGARVIMVPPLRDEPADILTLAEIFLADMGSAPDGSPRLLSEHTKRILASHSWPGNVQQLRLALETAAAQAGPHQIAPRHLPAELAEEDAARPTKALPTLEEMERRHIHDVLKRLGGNRAKTAQALGIASSTLYEKLRRYGIEG